MAGPGSSRSNPVPPGKPGNLGNGWTLTITGVNTDATDAIVGANPGNAAPLSGFQDVLVAVTATYKGPPASSHLSPDTSFRAVGQSGYAYSPTGAFCGVLPSPDLDAVNPLTFSGGTIMGNAACWMVKASDVPSLVMYYQPLLSNQPAVWFALH